MDLHFLSKIFKKYPKFWESYLEKFENNDSLESFIVFDIFLNSKQNLERIIAIKISKNGIEIGSFFDAEIIQFLLAESENEIDYSSSEEKIVEAEAIIRFLSFINGSTLVSFQTDSKIEIINNGLEKINAGRLKNQYMDLFIMFQKLHQLDNERVSNLTLNEIASNYSIKKSSQSFIDQLYMVSLLFMILKRKLDIPVHL